MLEQLQAERVQTLIPVKESENGELLISARELHEFLESSERFSKWFNRMISYGFIENEDFTSGQKSTVVNNGALRKLEDYNLTVDMAKEISMIQRNEKGKQARQYFLQIEKAWNSPEMIMKRALQIADKKIVTLEQQIQLDRPKVIFADAVNSSTTSILVGELAKLISQNGYDIGQNRLFAWLRENGYLIRKKGETFNLPTQRSMDMELMEIKKRTINNADGSIRTTRTTKVTGKGQQYFINKFLS